MSTRYDETYFVNRTNSLNTFVQLAKLPDSKFSLMLVRAGEKMGKTWLLRKMERHSRDVLRLPITHVDFRHPRDASQVSDFLGLIRLLRDRFEQPEAFVALNATIRQFTDKKPVGSGVFITNLSDKFVERFTFATLDYLARRIGIRYDNIPARDNTLSSKALAFVTMAFEGQLMELLFVALEKKSAEDGYNLPPNYWREGYADLFPQVVTGQAAQADNYAPIRFTTPLEYENAKQQITRAFFADLQKIMDKTRQVIILIDAWENAADDIVAWLQQALFTHVHDYIAMREHDPRPQSQKLLVIIAGRATPDLSTKPVFNYIVPDRNNQLHRFFQLKPFRGDQFAFLVEYMEKRRNLHETDIVNWRSVELLSEGIPGEIARFADLLEQDQAIATTETVALNGMDDPFFAQPVGV